MQTGSPPISRVITMVLFALSCVGLLLFLWLSFGGTIPLGAQGYRINVSFPSAQDLATQADVRIAGVSVGKVVSTQLDPKGNRTMATLQLEHQYAPIRQVLDVQHLATVRLIQSGGTVFGALGADQPALRNLITSAEATFATTAQNNNKLAQTFQVFPTFLNETKATMAKLQTFSVNTD